MSTVTAIKSCTTTACAYNHGGCTAFAITVGGDSAAPACSTFVSLDARGGLPVAEGHVGACQRLECVHNTDLRRRHHWDGHGHLPVLRDSLSAPAARPLATPAAQGRTPGVAAVGIQRWGGPQRPPHHIMIMALTPQSRGPSRKEPTDQCVLDEAPQLSAGLVGAGRAGREEDLQGVGALALQPQQRNGVRRDVHAQHPPPQ